jgi:hypothetical protein
MSRDLENQGIYLRDEFMSEYFVGPDLHAVVETITNNGVMLTQAEIAKRTGLLAGTIHGHTEVGPVQEGEPRWIGEVTIGGQGSLGTPMGTPGINTGKAFHDYAASYEFGAGNHPGSTGRHVNRPAHVLDIVRQQLGVV